VSSASLASEGRLLISTFLSSEMMTHQYPWILNGDNTVNIVSSIENFLKRCTVFDEESGRIGQLLPRQLLRESCLSKKLPIYHAVKSIRLKKAEEQRAEQNFKQSVVCASSR
jgi:hypothetical protein